MQRIDPISVNSLPLSLSLGDEAATHASENDPPPPQLQSSTGQPARPARGWNSQEGSDLFDRRVKARLDLSMLRKVHQDLARMSLPELNILAARGLADTLREVPPALNAGDDVLARPASPPPPPTWRHPFTFVMQPQPAHWESLTEQLTQLTNAARLARAQNDLGPQAMAELGNDILVRQTGYGIGEKAVDASLCELSQETPDALHWLATIGVVQRYQADQKNLLHLWDAYSNLAKHTKSSPPQQAQGQAVAWFAQWARVLAMLSRRLGDVDATVERLGGALAVLNAPRGEGCPSAVRPLWVPEMWSAPRRHLRLETEENARNARFSYERAIELMQQRRVHLQYEIAEWRQRVKAAHGPGWPRSREAITLRQGRCMHHCRAGHLA